MSVERGASTKGIIKNINTGGTMKFLYNPSEINNSRGVEFSEISSPGSSYPKIQYVKGEIEKINFNLFLYDNSSLELQEQVDFIEELMPNKKNRLEFNPPPRILFSFGSMVKKCVLQNRDINYTRFNRNLEPIQAQVEVNLICL